jgi:hypothetical protein
LRSARKHGLLLNALSSSLLCLELLEKKEVLRSQILSLVDSGDLESLSVNALSVPELRLGASDGLAVEECLKFLDIGECVRLHI